MAEDEADLKAALLAHGYLESGVARFLRPSGPVGGGAVRSAARIAAVGGPPLALLVFVFHAVADRLLLADASRLASLAAILLAGEMVLVFVVSWPLLLLIRVRPARGRAQTLDVLGAVALVALAVSAWWRLRETLAVGWERAVADVAAGFLALGSGLLLFRILSVATRTAHVGGRPARLLRVATPLVVVSLLFVVASVWFPGRFEPRPGSRFDVDATGHRVLWIALDGIGPELLDRARGEGLMPRLSARLAAGGVVPLLTGPSSSAGELWTTVATGTLPAAHGVHRFARSRLAWRGGSGWHTALAALFPILVELDATPLSATERRVPTVGEIVAARDYRVVSVNAWCTGPAAPGDRQWLVSDRAVRGAVVGQRPGPADLSPAAARDASESVWSAFAAASPAARRRGVDALCLELAAALIGGRTASPDLTIVSLAGADLLRLDGATAEIRAEHLRDLDRALDTFIATWSGSRTLLVTALDAGGDGVALLDGAPFDVAPGAVLRAVDVAPLVLRVLGFPHARDLPGSAPARVLSAELLEQHPGREIATYGERAARTRESLAAERAHLEALRTLGYLRGR